MHPATPTRVAARVTTFPEATREEMLIQAGIRGSAHWNEISRSRPSVDVSGDGDNHTYYPVGAFGSWDGVEEAEHNLEALGFILDGGWSIVDPSRGTAGGTGFTPGARDAGMTAHRGVLHPDEYVDVPLLQLMFERRLGFTWDAVRSVYRQGPLSSEGRALRSRIDARLLAISDAGGNMLVLAKCLGWGIEAASSGGGERCKTMERAIERARSSEAVAA